MFALVGRFVASQERGRVRIAAPEVWRPFGPLFGAPKAEQEKSIHFTQEQKDLAARTDLEVFLRSRGEKLLPSGRDKRLASDHSVTIRGNHWFDHATHEGGNAISFV